MHSKSLDSAIIRALGLDAASTSVTQHGGSGFSQTLKIISGDSTFFMKQGHGHNAEIMFRGEYESLNAINAAVPNFCPKALAHGPLSSSDKQQGSFFLVTEFLDLSSSSSSSSKSTPTLASKLAKLHNTPAPNPTVYGFPVPTCCGETVQDNTFTIGPYKWAYFFAHNRLQHIIKDARNEARDVELVEWVDRMTGGPTIGTKQQLQENNDLGSGPQPGRDRVGGVVNRLLSRMKEPTAVCCHGDLWSGNHSIGKILGKMNSPEAVVYDPSGVYAPAEYDAGIMNMFSNYSPSFWQEYHTLCPITEPVSEYSDRVKLYTLYHQLNHHKMFGGGGYRSAAIRIMKELWEKYKDEV